MFIEKIHCYFWVVFIPIGRCILGHQRVHNQTLNIGCVLDKASPLRLQKASHITLISLNICKSNNILVIESFCEKKSLLTSFQCLFFLFKWLWGYYWPLYSSIALVNSLLIHPDPSPNHGTHKSSVRRRAQCHSDHQAPYAWKGTRTTCIRLWYISMQYCTSDRVQEFCKTKKSLH